MKKRIFITVILISTVICAFHKYYFSITQVDYNKENQSLEIISRIFYDDLEATLQQRYNPEIRVDKSYPKDKLEDYIAKYYNSKFKIAVNGEAVQLNYLGHKDEDNYIVSFIEVQDIPSIKSIEIENTLLTDVFTSQKNVVHLKVGEVKKSYLLHLDNDKAMLKF